MNTITVWLLVMGGSVNSGGLGAVQPFMFPNVEACEQVASNARPLLSGRGVHWKCIQTTVVK